MLELIHLVAQKAVLFIIILQSLILANPNFSNFTHIFFNKRNGDWLAAELDGTNVEFTDCSFKSGNVEIFGSES